MRISSQIARWGAVLAASCGAAVLANASPVITKQPQGTSILTHSIYTLSVEATGVAPLTYQWRFNSSPIASATGPSYTLSNIPKSSEGSYQVVVTDSSGDTTSTAAQVYVVASDVTTIDTDLVARYSFDDTVTDITGRGNDGVKVGFPGRTVSGKIGGSSVVVSTASDGSAFNYVDLGIPEDFDFGSGTDFTVAFWAQPSTNTTGEFPLIANRDFSASTNPGWGISMGEDGSLHCYVAGSPGTPKSFGAPATLNDGDWHHIAVTFHRSGDASIWLDGAMIGTITLGASANDLTTPAGLSLNFGQDGTGGYNVNGAGINAPFDDLGIWRRVLTAQEIAWIYAKGAQHVGIQENVFNLSGAQVTQVTGQWDFDQGDLRATTGQALEYGDGPGGYQQTQTSFGTTTSYGIADIGGQVAKVMKYTRDEAPPDNFVPGYTMHHGIAPNGGGTLVNQWTLVADILIPDLSQGGKYSAVIEIQNDLNSDADVSIHEESPGVGGIGISGDYPGAITAGEWHRIVVAVDMSAEAPVISKFVDGVKAGDQINASGRGLDGRFSLSDVAHLFSDGGHDNEVNTFYVNSVQIHDGKLSDDVAAALGGAQATGIPLPNKVTGQWDFDQGDLRASVGQALEYGDGPDGYQQTQTSFGTTTSFGIADIGGQVATVMKYTRDEAPPDNFVPGFTMHHGIAPNGGGTLVNQWTLVADILIPDLSQGGKYSAVIEIQNDLNSDADVSIHEESPGVGGIGISGDYPGAITAGQWHRIVVAVDMSAATPVISKFVDGVKAGDQINASGRGLDGRFSLSDVAHLFSDGGHDNEVNTFFVNSVQIRDGKLSDDDAAALGAAQATGIPLPNHVTGEWDFDQGDLRATLGQDLEYGDGADGYQKTQTSFGTTTSYGIADIGGQVAQVMKYTRDEAPPENFVPGFTMHHGIAANGGGTLVNQWTLVADILIPDLSQGGKYSAVIEIQNDLNSDADVSIHEESPGVGGIGISGDYPGAITAGQWHRIVVAVDMSAAVPVISKFVDGVKAGDQINASGRGLDGRFSLSDVAHLFSDGGHDNEVNTFYVNSVQIRDGKLSDDDAAALGVAQASGIPLAIPLPVTTPPTLRITLSGGKVTISWDAAATGFTLESAASLTASTWTTVTGVSNNSVTVDVTGDAMYFRLR